MPGVQCEVEGKVFVQKLTLGIERTYERPTPSRKRDKVACTLSLRKDGVIEDVG